MTTNHLANHRGGHRETTGLAHRAVARARHAMIGLLLGATPGVILVLVAQFVIDGEMQLTVGAPGIVLAFAGGVVGLVVGASHAADRLRRAS